MDTITFLRQFRVGPIAIFDVVVSYIGIFLLSPFLTILAWKAGLSISRKSWLWLTIPVGVIFHLIFNQQTALNKMLVNPINNLFATVVVIIMVYMGVKDIQRVKKNSKKPSR